SEENARNSLQDLLRLIGLDPDAKLDINKHIDVSKLAAPDLEESIKIALANNPGYLSTLITLRQRERDLMAAKDAKRWELTMVATGSRELGRHNSDASVPNTRSAIFSLEVPVDDLNIDNKIATAKVALE